MKRQIRALCAGAVIAALYVVLTLLSNLFGLAGGSSPIQFRLSEMLCILPCFTAAAIPGLAIGCLLANLLTGAALFDVLFGAAATLLGALGTYFLRRHRVLATLPPIVSNTLIVPFLLKYVYGFDGAVPFFMLTVGIGEILTCGLGALLLYPALARREGEWKQ